MKKRVLHIDTMNKRIVETHVESLEDCQALVGGLIERGHILPNGDEVYVNEEGLLGEPRDFFKIARAYQPFAGNGYIIGSVTEDGDNRSAVTTIEQAVNLVVFLKGRHV